MFDIDIERLMDLLNEESDAYFDYCHKRNKLYDGNFDAWAERKENLEYARQRCDRAEDAVQAVAEIFRLNKDQVKRLYIAGRAIKNGASVQNGRNSFLMKCKNRLNILSLAISPLRLLAVNIAGDGRKDIKEEMTP